MNRRKTTIGGAREERKLAILRRLTVWRHPKEVAGIIGHTHPHTRELLKELVVEGLAETAPTDSVHHCESLAFRRTKKGAEYYADRSTTAG